MDNINNHIILIGFMGTGKSSVSQELAKELNMQLIDTDQEIANKEQLDIQVIFETMGEEYFRSLESELLIKAVQSKEPLIISTGGGIVLARDNRELIKQHYAILLQASIEEIYQRVRHNDDRPLLKGNGNMKEKLTQILASRKDLYLSTANIIINTDNKEVKAIVQEIIRNVFP